jgi:hypothetical protein
VLCLGTALGYLGDEADRAALREFRRVLAPGGRLREYEARPLASGGVLRFERRFDRARGAMRETQLLENGTGDGSPRAYELRVSGARATAHGRGRRLRAHRAPCVTRRAGRTVPGHSEERS